MPALRRGLWAETAPLEALRDAATWRLLGRHGLEVALAVRPAGVSLVAELVGLSREHGVRAALWPMIEDRAGRWLSVSNAALFAELVREVRAQARDAPVVLDLEPPFPLVRGALDGDRGALSGLFSLVRESPERLTGERVMAALCSEIVASGAELTLGVVPFVMFDSAGRSGGWGRLCGAPWELPATGVNVMLYTSLIEGYSMGILRRDDARALLAEGCRAAVARLGERASVSIGAVGAGALGDEPVYPDPAALADDAAIAHAAGARDVWLFDLGGVLSRGAPERWLEAFVAPPQLVSLPRSTVRARAVAAALWGAGRALGLGGPRR